MPNPVQIRVKPGVSLERITRVLPGKLTKRVHCPASNRKRCDAEQSRSTGRREKEHRPTGLYSKGTGRNACRYLASNQKRCHAEQSEEQEYRPPGLYSKGTGRNACRYLASNQKRCHAEQSEEQEYRPPGLYSKGTGRNACRYLSFRNYLSFPRDRDLRNSRNIRNIRNIRNNYVASRISARENRAGGRL